eukprot:SAG31_NODE_7807_length_1592_cov_2.002009_1_plen_232_part_00
MGLIEKYGTNRESVTLQSSALRNERRALALALSAYKDLRAEFPDSPAEDTNHGEPTVDVTAPQPCDKRGDAQTTDDHHSPRQGPVNGLSALSAVEQTRDDKGLPIAYIEQPAPFIGTEASSASRPHSEAKLTECSFDGRDHEGPRSCDIVNADAICEDEENHPHEASQVTAADEAEGDGATTPKRRSDEVASATELKQSKGRSEDAGPKRAKVELVLGHPRPDDSESAQIS